MLTFKTSFQPSTGLKRVSDGKQAGATQKEKDSGIKRVEAGGEAAALTGRVPIQAPQSAPDQVDTLIIGSVALDFISTLKKTPVLADSNPGVTKSSVGGVGYNVSLAHTYGLKSQNSKAMSRFVSAVGDDLAGRSIAEQIEQKSDIALLKLKGSESALYSAILDPDGALLLACADMSLFENPAIVKHLMSEIQRAKPRFIVVDCNFLAEILDEILRAAESLPIKPKIIVEPTSAPKLARLGAVNSARLGVFPQNLILMITPTTAELESIHSAFSRRELFDDYDEWFPALDSFGLDANFREKLSALGNKYPVVRQLIEKGVFQQAFQLLPYIPMILVKLGALGCVAIKLSTNVNDYKSIPTTLPHRPALTTISKGRMHEPGQNFGVVIEFFDIPIENSQLQITNVTGAGDTLVGVLSSTLTDVDWLRADIETVEQEWGKWLAVYKSQLASGLTLQSNEAVSPQIQNL